jgi:hypothetical protein
MKTITFDLHSTYWSYNEESNQYYVNTQAEYFQEILMARGYIYLNQMYEILGVEWNPDWDNICYRATNGPLRIEIKEGFGYVYFVEIDQ